MVFKDIEKFNKNKKRKEEVKREHLKNQFIECFFKVNPPETIKRKVKASLNESYLPSFRCNYKLRSSLEEVDHEKYIEVINDKEENYLLVDFDFHNIKRELNDTSFLETSRLYKKFKKELGSDFQFEVEGRTEDGTISIQFCKVYKPLLSRFFN
ncbi:hypothetical protein FIU87_19500 [Bacillus sp. THAF10]|uniref:hypothetical protein n=1 Tax=Bacillus sp. THAF10 TaxID=2587848 RepID=UPI001268CB6C|nr:hypothetical protein [Bacillus sp. THAF10]QFT90836.1 hypothetical protein FIU87_19500 [Bacillus sp. THAF10]